MKCPKCGFNSFEFLDSCKKCGANLVSFKKNHGIDAIVYTAAPLLIEVDQDITAAAMPGAAGLSTASVTPPPLPESDASEELTWDFTSEVTPPDAEFPEFNLDFLKENENQQGQKLSSSFAEEPPVEDKMEESTPSSAHDFSDFSFYEETLEPEEIVTAAEGDSDADIFGKTGVIGEILPEQLEAAGLEQEQDEQPQRYDNEFVLEDFAEEPEELVLEEVEESENEKTFLNLADLKEELQPTPQAKQAESYDNDLVFDDFPAMEELPLEHEEVELKQVKDPLDLVDFDKEFELLFATEEISAGDKGPS